MVVALETIMREQNLSRHRLSLLLCVSYQTVVTALERRRRVSTSVLEEMIEFLAKYGVVVDNPTIDDPL